MTDLQFYLFVCCAHFFTIGVKEIENKYIDREYLTQYNVEVAFLKEKGIRYSFVKVLNGITTYKYAKTEELFKALTEFYKGK